MSKIFFTSDTHFSHRNIIQYCSRPWSTVDEMDLALVERWNEKVGEQDTIYVLGDVFFCDTERALAILDALNGVKFLILGNHDRRIRNNGAVLGRFSAVLPDLYATEIEGTHVVMCHFPLLSWDREHYGSVMLHGHSHGNVKFDATRRRLDVGVDANNYSPVEWAEIQQQLGI
jgi:calcineurin-like phosphoesterase family protein